MIYNEEQEKIINEAVNHVLYGNNQVYQFGGKPGTGKTEVLKEIIRRIDIPIEQVAIMTYIGQASIVLRSRGLYTAKTIHSTLYEFVEQVITDDHGNPIMDSTYNKPIVKLVFRPKQLKGIRYMIIDEGRTVPLKMKHEIERRGLKVIVAGDWRQLPPVADEPAYLRDQDIENIPVLTKIVRQKENSNILKIADMVYEGIQPLCGYYGDVLVIEQNQLTNDMLASANIVICGTNKTRVFYNHKIREDIYGYHGKFPKCGEKLICRKNDWTFEINGISLSNGLIGKVISEPKVLDFDGSNFYIDFMPDIFNCCFSNIKCDYEYFTATLENKNILKNNKYNNGHKFEFAYTITTHLAQGAQYPSGIYIKEYMGDKNMQRCLDLTAVTRFQKLIYVLPNTSSLF